VLSNWPPLHTAEQAVVIVYCSGQGRAIRRHSLGPHNGRTATGHLYPLKNMESALAKLKTKQILFIFDGLVTRLPPKTHAKPTVPEWGFEGENKIRLIGGEELQQGLENSRHRHGLFTYYLLRGLRGEADTNRDNDVTLGELTGYVRQKVAWAAKTQFNQDQRPLLLPPLKPDDPAASLVLTALPSLTSSEAR
jgi:hypothetical protein